jgi:hypothetical protein
MKRLKDRFICECGRKAVGFAFWRDAKFYEDCKEYEKKISEAGLPKIHCFTGKDLVDALDDNSVISEQMRADDELYRKYGGKYAVKKMCDNCLSFHGYEYFIEGVEFWKPVKGFEWIIHMSEKNWFDFDSFIAEIKRVYKKLTKEELHQKHIEWSSR